MKLKKIPSRLYLSWILIILPGLALSGGISAIVPVLATHNIQARPAPTHTTSFYEQNTDTLTLQKQGCSTARGKGGLVILDFGEPEFKDGTYGIGLFSKAFVSDAAIEGAAVNFFKGALNCRTNATKIQLGIGLSNYNHPTRGLGPWTGRWYHAGKAWGQMVNNVQRFLVSHKYQNYFDAYGADDIEVDPKLYWATFDETANFVNGYNAASRRLFVDFGDDPGGTHPAPWTAEQLWYVANGAPNNVILPEIYYDVDATLDWEALSRWSCMYKGRPLKIIGVMSEYPTGNSPVQAWNAMDKALATDSCTNSIRSMLHYVTNIQ